MIPEALIPEALNSKAHTIESGFKPDFARF
ncbi:MAG: hypothetical protein RL189_1031 [Pseudomonadota bacterium]|jgi:hypothetical protein